MACVKTVTHLKGCLCHNLLLVVIWSLSYLNVEALQMLPGSSSHTYSPALASPPNSGMFEPFEISPAVIPHYPFPLDQPLSPMYPSFPTTYNPILTGRCPVDFSLISNMTEKTATDCTASLSRVVRNVICCPQFSSLLHIFQGFFSSNSNALVLQSAVAEDCFKDIVSILASRGANGSISTMCSASSLQLTGSSCPVKDVTTFEKAVNTSRLLESCSTIDSLKECCRPVCQRAISEASLQLYGIRSNHSSVIDSKNLLEAPGQIDSLTDCKGVVHSWLARKLPFEDANKIFRLLSSCKVNKVCPLDFKQPSEVIKACRNIAAPSSSCCSSLNSYIADIQKQMLITNRQAIMCATVLGSMLQKAGVMTNVYELCDIDLKDFSLQAYGGQEGCLLRSLPTDMVYDNSAGFSFNCDLNDDTAALWPSSPSGAFSFCAPEMSLPALPTSSETGYRTHVPHFSVLILLFLVSKLY
ncbi:unnamed protein product [Cuscuta campestris]|uniref:Uncharacterized protein n=1 Tax=Cuscuta campestris TaxID=132261 RepID=A0A484L814_9ASTE|nr:unnamed protein product [Cuscuta campestris]